MKKLLLLFGVFFLITPLVNGQQIDLNSKSTQVLHENYIQKYKTYKTMGYVLLGGGVGMIIGGGAAYAAYANQGFNGASPSTAELLFIVIGPATALASIPFFIFAQKNKRKAKLLLKGESISFANKLYQSNYTAIALTIQF